MPLNARCKAPLADGLNPRSHLAFIDGLRFIMALFVLLHHAWLTVWPDFGSQPTGYITYFAGWLLYGHFGVSVFIVISGFCLMMPVAQSGGVLKGGGRTFFTRRARRILPPYLFALLLSTALIFTIIGQKTGTHWDVCLPLEKRSIVYLFLLNDIIPARSPNHAFWSIAVECHIYLLFPILILYWRRYGAIAGVITTLLAGYSLGWLLKGSQFAGLTPHFAGLFALGMLGAYIVFAKDSRVAQSARQLNWGLITGLSLAALILLCLRWPLGVIFSRLPILDFPAGVTAMSLLISGVLTPNYLIVRFLGSRPLAFCGGFAYSIYLIHAPLLQVFWQYVLHPYGLGRVETFWLLTLIGTPIILGVCYMFYLCCERPFLKYRAPV